MTRIRTLTLLGAAALTVAVLVRERLAGTAAAGTAVALMAEARELCRGTDRNPLPNPATSAAAARLAAGAEALAIAVGAAGRIGDRRLRGAVIELSEILGEDCRPGHIRTAGASPGFAGTAARRRRDRDEAVTPFLARLNGAALRAAARAGEVALEPVTEGAAGFGEPAEQTAPPALARVRGEDAANRTAGATGSRPGPSAPLAATAAETPAAKAPTIELEIGASEGHRRRVAGWAPVFRREAGTLRVARHALQAEIDRYSLVGSAGACREFGRILAGLDPRLGRAAPARELALRVERMLAAYRRGVADCQAGSVAAAYSYLSEGDREWSAMVRAAAGIVGARRPASRHGATRPEDAGTTPRR